MSKTQTEIFVALQQKWIDLHGIKNGDSVKVIRTFSKDEGGCISNFYNAYESVGKIYKINNTLNVNSSGMRYGINLFGGPVVPYFVLEPVKEEKLYHIGMRFKYKNDNRNELILAASSNESVKSPKATLVYLNTGEIVEYSTPVKDLNKITEKEFYKISNKQPENFTLINN